MIPLLLLELKLARTISFVDERLQSTENQLSGYRDFNNYLQGKERAAGRMNLEHVFSSLRFLGRYRVFLRKRHRPLVGAYFKRAEDLKTFLERFVHDYSLKEVERSNDFFEGRPFDGDQLEAIVKKETYNLVLASAGSGKTRTLTARVAYTVKRGANQHDILAPAYTKPAEEEMRNRLKNEYGIVEANVRTFHSLGREIARLSPNFRPGVADNQQQPEIIRKSCDRLRSDRLFARLLLDFALELQTYEVEEKEFASREKYYEFLRYQKHTTLGSRPVKSVGERDIANFLFLNHVKFEYEAPATWADRNVGYRTYQPDFFLPEYGIWIEHWAINRQGNVPAWFSTGQSTDPSIRYRHGMQWKRYQFQKHRRRLIETYNYQCSEETLIPELTRQLEENHVQLRELTNEEILDKIQMLIPRRDTLNELMFSFISKAKTNGLTMVDVTARLRQGNWTRKQRVFASLMIRVWQQYESILRENDMIDFNDMINYALQVSKTQQPIRLVQKPRDDEKLYDDWQHEEAKRLVTDLIREKRPGEEIMVLSRFNRPLKRLELEFPQNETVGLRFLSIHRAKGMEAEYVLLLSCISGTNGFPSEILDRRVLDIVQNTREDGSGKLEEERRLFYVALTRCKNQLYLFTSSAQRSQFIWETQPYLSPWTGPEHTVVPA